MTKKLAQTILAACWIAYVVASTIALYKSNKSIIAGNTVIRTLKDVLPGIDWMHAECPDCHDVHRQLVHIIVHLNDDHRWSRNDIADWLETLDWDLTIAPAA